MWEDLEIISFGSLGLVYDRDYAGAQRRNIALPKINESVR